MHEQKTALRRQLRSLFSAADESARTEDSARAGALLVAQRVWQQARSLLFYAPMPGEVDLLSLVPKALADGKAVGLPRFDPIGQAYGAGQITGDSSDLVAGRFGILEPRSALPELAVNGLDLVLVPGVGFDLQGYRLGRGRGYYDRLLARVSGVKCGVAFDCQVGIEIPVEPHDIRMDTLLTPTRWLVFTG